MCVWLNVDNLPANVYDARAFTVAQYVYVNSTSHSW